MQTSSTSLLRNYVHFIPYSLIKDVVVNEAIQQVGYYHWCLEQATYM